MNVAAPQKYCTMLILLTVTLFLPLGSVCLAGGGQHYANGFTDFVSGAVPPPGTYLENQIFIIQKDRLVDNEGATAPVDFSADLRVNGARFIHVTPFTLFGASYGVQTIIPWYGADLEISTDAASPGDLVDSNEAGIGDIVLTPIFLGWHFGPNLHAAFGLDFFAPTGNYDSRRPATQILARNHWTVEPAVAVTYLWKGFDLSAKFMYDFHGKNEDYLDPGTGQEAELEPGQEFHVDWALGYAPREGLRFGLAGYNHWQTTDDEIDGQAVEDDRSRIGGIGPAIKYWPHRGPFSLTLKHYWEYAGRNIAVGQTSMLKLGYRF